MKKKIFIKNTGILTLTNCINRMIGLGFRIHLTHTVGAVGVGLYQLVSVGYSFAVVLTASGLSFAVMRIVSVYFAQKRMEQSRQVVKVCMIVGVILGILIGICMFMFATELSKYIFRDDRVGLSFKILSFSLPFLAISACMRGYFYAVKNVFAVSTEQILEQVVEIVVFAVIVGICHVRSPKYICASVVLGTVIAEILSCLYSYLFFYRKTKRGLDKIKFSINGTIKEIVAISVPETFSSCINSGLSVFENISIPRGLYKNGLDLDRSLGIYGKLTGMVYPIILFPSSILLSASILVIPELSASYALKNYKTIRRISYKLILVSFIFSFFVAIILFFCADFIGTFIYHNDCGAYIRVFIPTIPVLYVNVIIDGILKGINKQLKLMTYDFANAVMRVVLTLILVPLFGIKGEIIIVFASAIIITTLNLIQFVKFVSLHNEDI